MTFDVASLFCGAEKNRSSNAYYSDIYHTITSRLEFLIGRRAYNWLRFCAIAKNYQQPDYR